MASKDLRSMQLDGLLSHVYELYAAPTRENSDPLTVNTLKRDLADQLSAIARLATTFRGDVKSVFFDVKLQPELRPTRQQIDVHDSEPLHRGPADPKSVARKWKSGSVSIGSWKKALAEHYQQRRQQSLPVDHSLLKQVITRFGPEHPSEVLEVVEVIYAYDPEMAHFDTTLLQKWLLLVATEGSATSAVPALHAVLDLADQIEWTSSFHFLCRLVAMLGVKGMDNASLFDRPNPLETLPPSTSELDVLYRKLMGLRERYIQVDPYRFPSWEAWEGDWK
jgi:hypothetical protein